MFPDIAGGQSEVDFLSGNPSNMKEILAVPKIDAGTGVQQENACLHALDKKELKSQVRGLDTTSSNTGLYTGTYTILEQTLGRDLVWIGCTHHVFEVMLASVFTAAFETSGGPEVVLVTRLQKHWPKVSNEVFITGRDTLFNSD